MSTEYRKARRQRNKKNRQTKRKEKYIRYLRVHQMAFCSASQVYCPFPVYSICVETRASLSLSWKSQKRTERHEHKKRDRNSRRVRRCREEENPFPFSCLKTSESLDSLWTASRVSDLAL
uniref:Uncharacterized protein n=1 Tax=Toxoplasma gondii COUG TaxID=1074873 RepID=A0A2G8XVK3_TOXGO|nr:hypothetical protein TGCOUG_394440 [Toxoplasma gondii COUG]